MHKHKPTTPLLRAAAAAAAIALAAAGAQAQQAPKPEQLIKWRQSAFQVIAWNTARVKAAVDGGDRQQAAKAAAAIAALANDGLLALFPPGTETGKGWHDTSVKPELFKETDKVNAAYADFAKEANELARVAAAGDAAALKDQFGKLGKTCKGCHDDFRNAN